MTFLNLKGLISIEDVLIRCIKSNLMKIYHGRLLVFSFEVKVEKLGLRVDKKVRDVMQKNIRTVM